MILTPTTKPKLCVSILGFLTQIAAGVKGEREEREEREGMQAREVLREPNASLGCYPSGLLLFIKSKSDFSLEISSEEFSLPRKLLVGEEEENQRRRESLRNCLNVSDDAMERKKVALVTAATEGIGFAIARRLAREGCHVIISSRKQVSLCAVFGSHTPQTYENLNLQNVCLLKNETHERITSTGL